MQCGQKHCHCSWEGQSQGVPFQVLCILLQHPAVCSSHAAVRSLAQTCKAVREALQQSTAGSMQVSSFCLEQHNAVPTIKAFAAWMAKYPGLQLDLTVSGRPGAGLSRPGQLTSLAVCARGDEAGTDVQHLGISALQQLQELELTDALFQAEQLQQLTCLTKLQQLSLMYTSTAKARSAAPAWRQLSCLHSLEIRDCRAQLSMEEGQQLLAAAGAATSLVELDLSADGSLLDEETDICSYFTLSADGSLLDEEADICSYFTGLQRLTCLCLDSINGPHEKTDTPQLTKLTRLAELRIRGAWGIDDAAATAIARSLTQLTALQLQDCLITNRAVLQAIARLPLLEWLDLSGNAEALDDGSCLQDEDIEVLLPLPNLTYFKAAGTFGYCVFFFFLCQVCADVLAMSAV
ncbi:hypothetical protein OEZ85_002515 [Tetradesmus obliquus]|uniref:Uncharacterized protein n=1 Tax=Tetradesmus obliquus TaxID=3088 RepID=A0ABY8TXW5_TETOB|nr:hypothetical protein OEZ85_002515 [Tetradesmus obliquus]